MRPRSLFPIDSGSAPMRVIVSKTASRTAAGSAARSFFARRVIPSSGKPELAPHLVQRKHPAGFDVFVTLAKRRQRLLVLEDVESLLKSLPFVRRNNDGSRTAIASDDDMLVATLDLVEQLGQRRASLGEGNDFRHALSVHNSVHVWRLVFTGNRSPSLTSALYRCGRCVTLPRRWRRVRIAARRRDGASPGRLSRPTTRPSSRVSLSTSRRRSSVIETASSTSTTSTRSSIAITRRPRSCGSSASAAARARTPRRLPRRSST